MRILKSDELGYHNRFTAGRYWVEDELRFVDFVSSDGVLAEVDGAFRAPLIHLGDGRFQDEYESVTFEPNGHSAHGVHRDTGARYELVRLTPWRPSARELETFTGRYSNFQIEREWSFHAESGVLTLERGALPGTELEPLRPGVFFSGDMLLEFQPDSGEKSTSVLVSTRRVMGLEFTRTSD